MDRMKPCPFCGSSDLVMCEMSFSYTEGYTAEVRCRRCGTSFRFDDWMHDPGKLWNMRADAGGDSDEIKKLQEENAALKAEVERLNALLLF